MSRRVNWDKDIVDHMTSPKVETLKRVIELEYFNEEYKDDLSVAMELNLSERSLYRYKKQAKELYDWNCQNCQHVAGADRD